MKKSVALFLAVLLVVTAGCSGNSSPAGDGKEPVTITFFQPGLEQPNMKEPTMQLIDRFEKKHPGIKVKVESVGWDEAYQKLVTAFNAGNPPDVIYGGTRWLPSFASMGAIMPLDEYAKDHMKLYHDPLQKAVTYKGKVYGIPRAFSSQVLIYRSDLIAEPPKTWDELVETAKKVQQKNKGMYGFGISGEKHVTTALQLFDYVFQNGGEVFDEKGNVQLNSPPSVEALQFYSDLHTKHKIVPNPLEYNREELPVLFKQGKIAMFVCGPWAKTIMGIEPDNKKTPYKTALLPKGKKGTASALVSDSLMISSKSEHPEAAWKFIQYITSPEEQKRYDKEHGLVPIQKEELKDPYFSEDPFFKPFVEMVSYGKPEPNPTAWEPFQDIVVDAVQKAMNGEDVKRVLDQAVQEIKQQKLEPK